MFYNVYLLHTLDKWALRILIEVVSDFQKMLLEKLIKAIFGIVLSLVQAYQKVYGIFDDDQTLGLPVLYKRKFLIMSLLKL